MRSRTLDEMRELAIARGGECLSESYCNCRTKLTWKCAKGHIWDATALHIKYQKSWCPKCAGLMPLTMEEMKKLAASKGGKCLSNAYVNVRSKLRWECTNGHTWEATPGSLRNMDSWCPTCARVAPLLLEDMQELAASRGGECLSEVYENSATKLRWRCEEGHVWDATPDNVKNGDQWCPQCSGNRTEELVRCYFEILFNGEAFPKCPGHPQLPSPGGGFLTLDGYSECLSLAFEYQGQQHYVEVDGFGPPGSLKKRKAYDAAKVECCRNALPQPIRLIVIPYTIQQEQLEGFIRARCQEMGVHVLCESNVDASMVKVRWGKQRLKEMQEIAASRNGQCLSDSYTNSWTKLEWCCAAGHKWEAKPNDIKTSKSWCPVCAGHEPLTLEDMKEMAESKGGTCLSDAYVNSTTKLRWRCAKGHVWEATPGNIRSRNSWCPVCSGKARLTIDGLREIAHQRGGQCLSDSYQNAHSKLRWRCAKGHEWEATAHDVKTHKTWCPKCALTPRTSGGQNINVGL